MKKKQTLLSRFVLQNRVFYIVFASKWDIKNVAKKLSEIIVSFHKETIFFKKDFFG